MDEKRVAEFIGIMLGDGSIGIYDTKAGDKIKKHRVVKVTLDSRNKKYIIYVSNLMKEVLNTEPRIFFRKKENAVDISTHRKEKLNFVLNELGLKISPKWNNMEIPKKFMKTELYSHVLRGLFDTDGSVTIFNNNGIIYPRIEIKICPSPAQKQFIEIIDNLGFNYKVQKLDKGEIRIRISGKTELKKWFEIVGSSNQLYIDRAKQFL
ncbi:MAG: LAGLIDADG family homing endonuclease [Candidatus Pacearchaeota archaeon]